MEDTEQAVRRLLAPQCGVLYTRRTSEGPWTRVHVMLRMDLWWRRLRERRTLLRKSTAKEEESVNSLESWDDWGKADGHMELKRSSESMVEWDSEMDPTNRAFKVVADDDCQWFRADKSTAESWKQAIEVRLMVWNDMLMANLSYSKDALLSTLGSLDREKKEKDGTGNRSRKVRTLGCISFLVKEFDAIFKTVVATRRHENKLVSGLKTVNNFTDLLAGAPYAGYAFRVIGMGLDLATKLAEEEAVFGKAKDMFERLTGVLMKALLCAQDSGDATGLDDFLSLVEKIEVAGHQLEQYCFSSKAGKVKLVILRRPYRPSELVEELAKMEAALNLLLSSGSYRGIARMLHAPGSIQSQALGSDARQMSLIERNSKATPDIYETFPPWPKIIPESDGRMYVGNSGLLEQISDILSAGSELEGRAQSLRIVLKCVVSGMGGIGKTELVKQYARRKMNYYKGGVYWVQAERERTLIESFREMRDKIALFVGYRSGSGNLARREVASGNEHDEKRLMSDCESFLKRLGGDKGVWLVILDNADDIEGENDFRLKWLPRQGRGHVIVTTKLDSKRREFKEFVKACSPMEEARTMNKLDGIDSRSLLLLHAGKSGTELSSDDEESITKIVGTNALDGHPLALVQAGGYIGEENIPFWEYWQQIDRYDVPKTIEMQSGGEEKSILKTFLVSKSKLSTAAQELLSVLCWLPSDGAAESMLWECGDGSLNAFENSEIIKYFGGVKYPGTQSHRRRKSTRVRQLITQIRKTMRISREKRDGDGDMLISADRLLGTGRHFTDREAPQKRMKGRQLITEICKYRLAWREDRDGESFLSAHRLVYSIERAELENWVRSAKALDDVGDQCSAQLRQALITAIMVLRRQQVRRNGMILSYEEEEKENLKAAPTRELYILMGELLHDCTNYDDASCVRFFQTAANLGHTYAMVILGRKLEYGKGAEKSEKDAVEWYRKAASLEGAVGMVDLGRMFENGKGVEKSEKDAVEWYRKAADLEDADGMVNLGLMFENGKGVEKSEKDAVEWYRKAADLEDAYGMVNLGTMLECGKGVEKSEKDAVEWYRKAADLEDAYGMVNLGRMFENGKGVEKSEKDAVEWYRKAADLEDADGMVYLGLMFEYGKGVEKSEKDAVEWYRKAADLEDAYGMVNLGRMFENGKGVEKSEKDAVEWYRKAGDLEGGVGMVNLGRMLENGKGMEKSEKDAVEWYRKAADLEDAYGMVSLGRMLKNGKGLEKSEKDAVEWYRKAADLGYAGGMVYLGLMLEYGKGVEKSEKDAVEWSRKAADLGCAGGMVYLGLMLKNGKGVEKSEKDAVEWFRKAADLGYAGGMVYLGLMLENGKGVEESEKDAVEWYRKAAYLGDANGMVNLGWGFEYGRGVEKSEKDAVEWYRKAAELDHTDGMVNLGISYAKGIAGAKKDRKAAFELMLRASRLDDSYAWLNLGEFHVNGIGVPESAMEGARLWRKATQSVAKGMKVWLKWDINNEYGMQRRSGRKIIVWDELEAESPSLGDLKPTFVVLDRDDESNRVNGSSVVLSDEIDPEFHRCKHAEKERDAEKIFMLGLCYERGKGVDVNLEEAYELYMEAGVMGSLKALRKIFLDM